MSDYESQHEDAIEWLKTASPDDWHRVALDFNWDEDVAPLFWIVQQPECDRATALDIFWKGQPAWYLLMAVKEGRAESDDPIWTMLKYIAARLNARGYTRSKIAFDATPELRQDYEELAGYAKQLPDAPLKVHGDMLRSLRGREIVNDEDFYRRYPFAHSFSVDLPEIDEATIRDVPDLVTARNDAASLVTNLFGVGFLAMGTVMYPGLLQNFLFLVIGLAALGICLYSAVSEFREMNGLLRINRLQFVPPYLIGTCLMAGLSGALVAALALKPIVALRSQLSEAYGTMGLVAVVLIGAGLVCLIYVLIGRGLGRVLISPRAMRDV